MLPLLVAALAVPTCVAAAYLLALTILSWRLTAPRRPSTRLRFDVVIPAHNEQTVIERAVCSARGLDWPRDQFRVLVIADNCTDATATIARDAGAEVLERHDLRQVGKGYALRAAFQACLAGGFADAVVVMDADSTAARNLLEAFAARIEIGAQAIQARYTVLNPRETWRTGMLAWAFACFHTVRSRARERLGLSCGIRGNGWCITQAALESVGYEAFSAAEDVEYGLSLGVAGVRVRFADETCVAAQMFTTAAETRRQRHRWETGRRHLLRTRIGWLLRSCVVQRQLLSLDLAIDLLIPPLSVLFAGATLALCGSVVLAQRGDHAAGWLWISALAFGGLMLHALRGWQLSGLGLQGIKLAALVPWFFLQKLGVSLGAASGNATKGRRH